jgi:hypothetical protein
MVSWQELRTSIDKNPRNGYNIPVLKIRTECIKPIDKYPLESLKDVATPANPLPSNILSTLSCPPSTPAKKSNFEKVPTMNAKPVLKRDPLPKPLARQIDPIVLGVADILYEQAAPTTKKQMECEEAQRIEGMLSSLYASEGGRSRGWTKVGLEAILKPRCSSGGDLYALDKSKSAFPWQLIRTDKTASAFLDFVCVAKKIRIAIWFMDEKSVFVYPAADKMGDVDVEYPLFHVSSNGFRMTRGNIPSCKELIPVCESESVSCFPPYSVAHSLANLTISDLNSIAMKLGMDEMTGTKAERLEKISQYKLRQRLLGKSS